MAQKSEIKDFTSGNVTKQLVVFALPLFLSNLLQVVYNMVDMIVVGQKLGDVGLSAVSVGGDISAFMTFVAMGFSAAGQVIISQYVGAKKPEKIAPFVSTMVWFLTLCGVVICALCLALRQPLLRLMNTPAESWSEALDYSTICASGLLFIYGYNVVSAILRGMGDSKHPFLFIGLAAVLNIGLDLLFVLVFDLGAGGAALATVISQGVSFLACLLFLIRKRKRFALEGIGWRDFVKPKKEMLSRLVRLGSPMAIKFAAVQFSKLFVNSFVNSYGVEVSAFSGIANKIGAISNLISNSLNTAGSGMIGQNLAARQYPRVKRIVGILFAITLSIAVLLSAVFLLFPRTVYGIFTQDEAVIAIALNYLPIACLLFFGSATRAPMNALINGSGNTSTNFLTAILDGIVLRLGLSSLFGLACGMGAYGFWLGDAIAGFTPFFIGLVFFATGAWKKQNRKAIQLEGEAESASPSAPDGAPANADPTLISADSTADGTALTDGADGAVLSENASANTPALSAEIASQTGDGTSAD